MVIASLVIAVVVFALLFVLVHTIPNGAKESKLLNTIVFTLVGLAAIYVVVEIILFLLMLYASGYDD